MINTKKLFLFAIMFSFLFSQGKIDGIIAIVDDNIILHSDVYQQSQLIALDQKIDPSKSPYLFEKI